MRCVRAVHENENFHGHMSGRHFRDYHLLLDEHADQIFAMTDDIAERARKIGGTTLHSIGEIAKHQRLKDNSREFVAPKEMLEELLADNKEARAVFPRRPRSVRKAQRHRNCKPD